MPEGVLYVFSTSLLRSFIPLFWGIFLLFYRRNFWQNFGISGVFLPIGVLYFFDSFSRLPSLMIVDIYDVRAYLIFICLPPFAKFYANYAFDIKISLSSFLHFIPFAVMLVFYLLLRTFEPHIPFCYDINELLGYFSQYPLYVSYYLMLIAIFSTQVFFYAIPITKQFIKVRNLHKKNGYSIKHLNQLIFVIISFCSYPFVCIFFFSYYNNLAVMITHNFSLPVFITVISVLCMNQKLPLKMNFAPHEFIPHAVVDESNTNSNDLKCRLHAFFEEKKPYRNSNLTLQYVADHLNTNRTYLSAFINEEYDCDFRKFLTSYRIEAAKKLLLDKDFDIKSIASAVGYNSRTTFYKAFKENVCDKLSPAEWREKQLNSFKVG